MEYSLSKQNKVASTDIGKQMPTNSMVGAARSFDETASAAAFARMAPESRREWQGSSQQRRIEAKLEAI